MASNVASPINQRSAGDAAVDGLCSGFFAGLVMAAYLALIGLLGRQDAGAFLAGVAPGSEAVLTGLIAHLAVATVYGALFGLGIWGLGHLRWSTIATLGAGPLYGVLLALLARTLILANGALPFADLPWLHLLLAHLLYGVALGFLFSRVTLFSHNGG